MLQIFFCFTITWFSLKALHMIESIETVPWPYISKMFFYSFYIHIMHSTQGLVLYWICNLYLGNSLWFDQVINIISIWCPDYPCMENSSIFWSVLKLVFIWYFAVFTTVFSCLSHSWFFLEKYRKSCRKASLYENQSPF